ncbi:ribbon-helix-helix protein, CopG family [Solwaraspora sp. WMMD1047]|uniref:ribbon-helix-helix protein, CopG family n=1 Tax=Solwaraspora sp. WMMD1047 TaxID=3016102 RepID=UPI002416FFE7|nr:ribbon-helix-helix protein, CopG family [Solwaraspora sp. WMMD1047]MDG4829470.1 ribbon-helix-helix protein, CopG family [Solwaraspora sp. WMMD1047]
MDEVMSEQEMINWVKENDLSALIREGEPVEAPRATEREIMAVRTVRLPAAVYEDLQDLAESRGMGTSVLMRKVIEEWVASQLAPTGPRDVVPVTELLDFVQRAARPAA